MTLAMAVRPKAEHREILRQALAAEAEPSFDVPVAGLRKLTKRRKQTPSEVLLDEGRQGAVNALPPAAPPEMFVNCQVAQRKRGRLSRVRVVCRAVPREYPAGHI